MELREESDRRVREGLGWIVWQPWKGTEPGVATTENGLDPIRLDRFDTVGGSMLIWILYQNIAFNTKISRLISPCVPIKLQVISLGYVSQRNFPFY